MMLCVTFFQPLRRHELTFQYSSQNKRHRKRKQLQSQSVSNEQVALSKAYRTENKQRDPLSLISSISWLKGPIRSRGSRGYLINDRGRERSRDGCHCGAVPATGQGKWCRRMASYGVHNFRDFGRRPGVAQEGSASTRMPAEWCRTEAAESRGTSTCSHSYLRMSWGLPDYRLTW